MVVVVMVLVLGAGTAIVAVMTVACKTQPFKTVAHAHVLGLIVLWCISKGNFLLRSRPT